MHSLLPTINSSIELLKFSTTLSSPSPPVVSQLKHRYITLRNTTLGPSGDSILTTFLTTVTLANMVHLEGDDETERLDPPGWKDFIPIVRLLIVPYNPIMEFARNAGPNSTANGVFLSLCITFWFRMFIFFFCKGFLDETTGDVIACSSILCYLVAGFCYSFILIANQVRRELRPNTRWTTSEHMNRLLSGTWWCFTLFVRLLFTPYIRITNQGRKGILVMAYYTAMGLCLAMLYVGCSFFFVGALLDPPLNEIRRDYWGLSRLCFFASSALYCLVLATTGHSGRLLWRYFTAVMRSLLTPYSFLIAEAGGSGIVPTVHAIFVCLLVTCLLLLSAWLFYLALLDPCISDANRIGLWLASIVSLLVAACMYVLTLATAIGSTMEDRQLEKLLVTSLLGRLGIEPRASSLKPSPKHQRESSPAPSETMGTASQPNPTTDPLALAHDDQFLRG
ncbi:hypothetical protein FALCPG4_005177 [Fusarium falciforme]